MLDEEIWTMVAMVVFAISFSFLKGGILSRIIFIPTKAIMFFVELIYLVLWWSRRVFEDVWFHALCLAEDITLSELLGFFYDLILCLAMAFTLCGPHILLPLPHSLHVCGTTIRVEMKGEKIW
jgi:hypothetical protein